MTERDFIYRQGKKFFKALSEQDFSGEQELLVITIYLARMIRVTAKANGFTEERTKKYIKLLRRTAMKHGEE